MIRNTMHPDVMLEYPVELKIHEVSGKNGKCLILKM